MTQAIASYEVSPSLLHCRLRTAEKWSASREEQSECLSDGSLSRPPTAVRTAQILAIGPDLSLPAQQLRRLSSATRYRIQIADNGSIALEHIRAHCPDVIVLDLGLPDRSGMEVYQQIRSINPRIPIIIVTRSKRANAAIEAMKQGAYDCFFHPLDLPTLQRVVGEALEVAECIRQAAAQEEPAADSEDDSDLVGASPVMGEVYKAIGRVAAQDVPVLITGESGTGKELVARAIHAHGPRAKAPFLALNCAAIPENLLESELFGHEKGAFTGADRRRIGKFEQCNGGTIFLDEVGDMPVSLQAKILRLIQEQTFERVGGNETIRTNVRLIAATNRDLSTWSLEGKFRPDLYYRLSVFTIHLPPLRERGDDLSLLVQHFLRRFSRDMGREVRQADPQTLERLRRYSWPGNIRELQSVLKQALLKATGPILLPTFLPESFEEPCGPAAAAPTTGELKGEAFVLRQRLGADVRDLYAETHRQADRLLLPRVLEFTKGNHRQAAILLGIARQTLRLKLRELGLAVARDVQKEEDDPVKIRPSDPLPLSQVS